MVVKGDNRREPYDHVKLKRSIQIACNKRPIATSIIDNVVNDIEARLRDKSQEEIAAREIGELVIEHLRKLDDVAYVRFASVYRNFQDKEEFLSELEDLRR
jgi:transcriptional repressor NrdR